MACIHLQQLYKLCHEHELKLSGSDLIHIVCHQCGEQEVCPSTLAEEYDAKSSRPANNPNDEQQTGESAT